MSLCVAIQWLLDHVACNMCLHCVIAIPASASMLMWLASLNGCAVLCVYSVFH